jgi:hypothetical protein
MNTGYPAGKKMELRHKGKRYWCSVDVGVDGVLWQFWSSHKWPFYHGHYKQRHLDHRDAWDQFIKWLPI